MEQVLLTGFPGFIARELVRTCRAARVDAFWHVIVLPEQMAEAAAWLQDEDVHRSEYALYPGDATNPDFGLPREDAEALQAVVTRCFHLAALTDITARREAAAKQTVWAARQCCMFLEGCPNLVQFNYVSSCFAAGALPGPVAEAPLPEPPGFHNACEWGKYEAEAVVRGYADRLPTTILRLASVVGHSQTGATIKFDGPYVAIRFFRWAHRLLYWMPNLGADDAWFNAVPVDFAADVLRCVGFDADAVGETLHVADPDPPTTAECLDAMHQQISGRPCLPVGEKTRGWLLRVLHWFPLDLFTGLPPAHLDYFTHDGRCATDRLEAACAKHGLGTPDWRSFYKPVIRFATVERKLAPNAGLEREFRRWCFAFKLIYLAVGLAMLGAPWLVAGVITVLDGYDAVQMLAAEHPLWRPLALSLLVVLFVAVVSLERNPFQKPLHILIVGAKFMSALMFLYFLFVYGMIAMAVCAVVDAAIGGAHLLFYYRLTRIRVMAGGEFRWNPYNLLFPERFLRDFAEAMTPQLDEPLDVAAVVDGIRAHVRRFPFHLRYAFLLSCYQMMLVMPCLLGFRPYSLMNRKGRRRFLARVQHARMLWFRGPLLFIKMMCSTYLFKQEPYLRSIGALEP